MSSRDFMLTGIDLRGLLVMDAGTGAANTTLWLAKKLKEAGDGRIISIDPTRKFSLILKENWVNSRSWLSL